MRHVKLARDRRRKKLQIKVMLFVAVILFVIFGVWLKNQEQTTPTDPSSVSISHSQDSVLSSQSDTDSSTVLAETHSAQAPLASDSQPLPSGTKTHFESTESTVSQSAARTDEGISASNHSRSSFDKQIESSSVESSLIREPQDTAQAQDKTKLEVNALDATSFYDDLDVKDDEVDEIKSDVMDELAEFPESARNVLNDLFDVIDQAMRIKNQFSHIVVKGDTLKDILELSGLEAQVSEGLIQDYAELKKLKPGQQFYWILDNQGELEYLNWLVSEREERIYERTEDDKFKRDILKKQSVWKQEVLKDQIDGSFNTTLRTLGLEARQINQLVNALQWQINLKRLRKGDKFALLVTREYIDNKLTGQGNVDGIHIISGGKSYYAIQANNGRYYNRQGETLGKGFARYPLQRQARVSSHFNPYRRHPVTGRIAPHKGVDFAMPIGTPIIAPAEGVVEKVAYQANGAGRYIVIRHGREYQTVYMHLSRPLVRAGQSVKRGERIALSGNTGRSTGPHLHYEFHINGRAVNPLTVKLPGTSNGMGTAERKTFLIRAKEVERKLKL